MATKVRPIQGKLIAAMHPNAGLMVDYRTKLDRLIEAMHRSLMRYVIAAYRATPPRMMAEDAAPARSINIRMRELGDRWLSRFDQAAPELAAWFAQSVERRSEYALRDILRRGGLSVRFQPSPASRDIVQATLAEQVNLIKSIGAEHLNRVEGMVNRSIQTGRDIGGLTRDLEDAYGISTRKAATIARHQNNMATASFTRLRQGELGIVTALWLHSGGGRHPRPSHVANSGQVYEIAKGWYDPDAREWIWPGTLINCRCVPKSIIPGLD